MRRRCCAGVDRNDDDGVFFLDDEVLDLVHLFRHVFLGISKGDFVTVKVEGNDETEAANVLENYFKENL